jgi:hypothetical protein
MTNTSATGGYLAPSPLPQPVVGLEFEDFLHSVIQQITGVAAQLIRPRWQPDPANLPQANQSWIAFGILDWEPDTYAVEEFNPANQGSMELTRHETVETLVSFYGPDANKNAAVFRDGLQISQNREALTAAGIGQRSTGKASHIPSLVKERWQSRVDVPWTFRRQIKRSYPVLYLLSAQNVLSVDSPKPLNTDIVVTNIIANP